MEDRKTRIMNTIYSKIAEEKRELNRCDEIQQELKRLNESLQSCLEIASNSIGNEQIRSKIQTLQFENNQCFKNSTSRLESDMKSHNDNITQLTKDGERISSTKKIKVV